MRRLTREAAEDSATAELRTAILTGSLSPGTRLRQEELAAQFGVSRMPVRQALLSLEREGLVRTDRWHQTIVAPLEVDMIRDMYEFRAVIERYVAETLANRADFDSSPIRDVIAAGRHNVVKGDVERAIELDLQFHTMLYDSVGNQVLSSFMRQQWAHIRRVMAVTLTLPKLRARVWDEHAAVLDAIEAHDPARAAAEAAAHMGAASATLLSQLQPATDVVDRIAEPAKAATAGARRRVGARKKGAKARSGGTRVVSRKRRRNSS
jgi:DNA-binding GntR family transcriptional regulator